MPHIGPLYCETLLAGLTPSVPIELVNTVSNLPTIFFGLFGLWYAYSRAPRRYELYILAALIVATGVGSTLWHATREPLALMLDVLPGLSFFLFLVFVWVALLSQRLSGLLSVLGLLLFQYGTFTLIGRSVVSPFMLMYGIVFVLGSLLLYFTWKRSRKATYFGGAAICFALIAATMRSIDLLACVRLPFGTHFLWHFALGFAALLAVMAMYRLGKK